MNNVQGDPDEKKGANLDAIVDVVVSWGEIKHHRHFEHIVALGSRVDMLVTANSLLIAGLLLMIFGSSESESIRSQIKPFIQILSFIFLACSLMLCIYTTFIRVKQKEVWPRNILKKIIKFVMNNIKNILVLLGKSEDFFSQTPKNSNDFVSQIDDYSKQARKSIAIRHRLMNLSAILTLLGLLTIGYMVITLIFDP